MTDLIKPLVKEIKFELNYLIEQGEFQWMKKF